MATEVATLALTLAKIVRRRNSVNGNPSYLLTFEGGIALQTAKDTAFAYEVTDALIGRTVYVRTDARGDVIDMTPLRLS